ncbi:MFS general substrate transporter [Armillaria gallica]|uniref:MFS general substrate transporter n=1 Tax=Armillaria gallica TaxID=47427 RepID=A0A2H3CZS1_ARMGA|nr:MFS general substrate transporter [Armillaria gallica]
MMPRANHLETEECPWGWKWRSSYWFVTFVMWLGTLVDILCFALSIPVIPFQLKALGYKDVASLTGWLMFAYSAGSVGSSVPVAIWSEMKHTRKVPYVTGVLMLMVSQIIFMEAPYYWVMCLARCIQGVGTGTRLVVGLAMLCDRSPSEVFGRQLGIAMSGGLLGMFLGAPIGGPLYARFGFHGPFIFGAIVSLPDLVLRLLVIGEGDASRPPSSLVISNHILGNNIVRSEAEVSLIRAFRLLLQSHRALGAAGVTVIISMIDTMLLPVLPSHLNHVWGLDASKVGLVILAVIVPSVFAPPIVGWFADRFGVPAVIIATSIFAMPWYTVLILEAHLSLFVVVDACATFFAAGLGTLVPTELAFVARTTDGVGYAHVYALYNFAFGIGSLAGPVVGGQMYDAIAKGWMAICFTVVGLLAFCVVATFFFLGEKPVGRGLLQRIRRR